MAASSKSSSFCCPPGSWPQALFQSEDDLNQDAPSFLPRGAVKTIPSKDAGGTISVYLAEPETATSSSNSRTIIVLQDIFSVRVFHPSSRSGDRLAFICDTLADALGCTVVMPSLFGENPVDVAMAAGQGKMEWLRAQSFDNVGPIVAATQNWLQERQGTVNNKVAAVGFCYGAWLLCKTTKWTCAVGCHPSTKNEVLQGGDEVKLLHQPNVSSTPTLFLCAGNDSEIYREKGPGQLALEATGGGVEHYPSMSHGWVCRGDMKDPAVKEGVEQALASTIQFLKKHMTTGE